MFIYPRTRPRRNRKTQEIRNLFAENFLKHSDLIMPLFITENTTYNTSIDTLPGITRYNLNNIVNKVQMLYDQGIVTVMLFPCIEQSLKSNDALEALNHQNLISKAIKKIKKYIPKVTVIADVALDPYTLHGHDGILNNDNSDVSNDKTIEILCKQAIVLANAGVDVISPSEMMDGRIGAIRDTLENYQYNNTQIFSYAVKYNSYFYTPFRDAIGSKFNLGNSGKQTYFMDYRNGNEALKEVQLDISEGADAIIIKPGTPYLDIIYRIKNTFIHTPVIAYQVSGEYSMLQLAIQNNIIDAKTALLEIMYGFKRAGANCIITYFADRIAEFL